MSKITGFWQKRQHHCALPLGDDAQVLHLGGKRVSQLRGKIYLPHLIFHLYSFPGTILPNHKRTVGCFTLHKASKAWDSGVLNSDCGVSQAEDYNLWIWHMAKMHKGGFITLMLISLHIFLWFLIKVLTIHKHRLAHTLFLANGYENADIKTNIAKQKITNSLPFMRRYLSSTPCSKSPKETRNALFGFRSKALLYVDCGSIETSK